MFKKTRFFVGGMLLSGAIAVTVARAQPAPPPFGGLDGGPPHMGMEDHDHQWRHDHWQRNKLIIPAEDRKLTAPEVQKVAEAFLIWNGNRSWKVTGIVENADNTVNFSYASPKGDVIATFKIDRKTGEVTRVS